MSLYFSATTLESKTMCSRSLVALFITSLRTCVKDIRTVERYVIERACDEREHIVLLSSVVAEKYKDIIYE